MNTIEKTKSFWSSGFGAILYRKFAGKRFLKMHQKTAERVLKENPKDVLDIGCGPGDFLLCLYNLNPKLNLVGTDIAPGMVKHASQKLSGKAKIFESKGESQPFAENSFDVITIMLAFHHIPKKLEVLRNTKKLLKTQGSLFIIDIVAKSNFQRILWNIMERFIVMRGYIGHYTENDIKELARKAGLGVSLENIPGMPNRYRICKLTK